MEKELAEACARYIAELFAPEDDLLKELRRSIAEAGFPGIYITPDEGRLLQVLVRAVGARRMVEIGTLAGYSAIWIARALPKDGRLVTIEKKPGHAELAREYIERAGLADRVEVCLGDGLQVLEKLSAEAPFDAVFIDADKQNYPRYLDWSAANLRPGGLVIGDNALWKGRVLEEDSQDPEVLGIQEFNRRIAEDPRFTSIIVPTRDGVAVAILNQG